MKNAMITTDEAKIVKQLTLMIQNGMMMQLTQVVFIREMDTKIHQAETMNQLNE
jgi:hypothetical protein